MHEMGMGISGINPHKGTARNPHNPQHITGGSSSGSAAAVTSGIVPFALGSFLKLWKNSGLNLNLTSSS